MTNWFACAAALAVASWLAPLPAAAQGEQAKSITPTTLTDADRAEIQKLTGQEPAGVYNDRAPDA